MHAGASPTHQGIRGNRGGGTVRGCELGEVPPPRELWGVSGVAFGGSGVRGENWRRFSGLGDWRLMPSEGRSGGAEGLTKGCPWEIHVVSVLRGTLQVSLDESWGVWGLGWRLGGRPVFNPGLGYGGIGGEGV